MSIKALTSTRLDKIRLDKRRMFKGKVGKQTESFMKVQGGTWQEKNISVRWKEEREKKEKRKEQLNITKNIFVYIKFTWCLRLDSCMRQKNSSSFNIY